MDWKGAIAMRSQEFVSLSRSVVFSALFVGLIAAAVGGIQPAIAGWTLIFVVALVVIMNVIVQHSTFLSIVLANFVGLYASSYTFFVEERFQGVPAIDIHIAFALPLIAFTLGICLQRRTIERLIQSRHTHIDTDLSRATLWVLPMAAIGVSTAFLKPGEMAPDLLGWALIGYMAVISLIAAATARDIAVFMLDLGLLFRDFSASATRLIKPAFAFFTWYSMLAIAYGCIYTIVDRYSALPNFQMSGVPRPITFPEGIYFSVVTLSSVGYGDIAAQSLPVRLLVVSEIIVGVLLFLFGVQAILATALQHRAPKSDT